MAANTPGFSPECLFSAFCRNFSMVSVLQCLPIADGASLSAAAGSQPHYGLPRSPGVQPTPGFPLCWAGTRALLLWGELGWRDMRPEKGGACRRCCSEGCLGGQDRQGASRWGPGARGLHWKQGKRGRPGALKKWGSIGGGGLGQKRGAME